MVPCHSSPVLGAGIQVQVQVLLTKVQVPRKYQVSRDHHDSQINCKSLAGMLRHKRSVADPIWELEIARPRLIREYTCTSSSASTTMDPKMALVKGDMINREPYFLRRIDRGLCRVEVEYYL